MIKIDEALENWLKEKEYIRKGRGKHEIAKLCDELKKKCSKDVGVCNPGRYIGRQEQFFQDRSRCHIHAYEI
ncbi:hypothetical protein [[Clostridium] innocuum]|nr:hypothetical protein [[Clostridium] innocuum]QIX10127.1 hypothetical protein G4D55_14055 [[Clostridium] innocuum]